MKRILTLAWWTLAALMIAAPAFAAMPVHQLADGSYVNAQQVPCDANGNALVSLGTTGDRDFGQIIPSGLGTVASLAPGNAVVIPTALDVHQFTRLTLKLTWNFASAADSDSVNICVNLYSKVSSNMGDGINGQLFVRMPAQVAAASGASSDTARVWNPTGVNATARGYLPPTLYVTRNTATGVNYAGVAYNHGNSWLVAMQPRWFWSGVGSIDIPLDNIGGLSGIQYLGLSIANVNVTKTLTNVTASLWASR